MDSNFREDIQDAEQRITEKEQILGKGLCQPFVEFRF